MPGTYAMQGYDTAMLIDSAVKAVKGDLKNKDAVSAALKKAEFTSLRGDFKFNVNGYPIQNFYLTKVAKRAGRQIPDRDRREGVFELWRPLRQGLHAGANRRLGRERHMKTEIAGITRANEGIQGISWNILGQTYVPKSVTEHSFSWHATFPPETFVPPHIHPDQDEYLYILEGQLDFFLDGAETQATPGDLVRLPMGKPHGIFNKSGRTSKVLFWVSPTRRLYDLFWGIHNMKEQTPDAVVALAAEHKSTSCRRLRRAVELMPAPPPAPTAAARSRPWTHSRARWLRAGRGSAPSRYR